MKFYKYTLFFVGVGLAVISAAFLLSSKDVSDKNTPDGYHSASAQTLSDESAMTVSVPVPDAVEFCGEKISLLRYDMHERFDREINTFAYLHATTLLYLKRANRFFPVIEPILKANGIPDDFKYLSVIESNLDIRAISPAKAAGLWQFMEATGKSLGLEISAEVDERYHVEKATEAACRYLNSAYNKYGNWVNVAASYNAGMGRISSEMNNQLVDSAFDLLLVSETSRYVFRIMAIKQIFENPDKYGFKLKKDALYPLIPTQYISVDKTIDDLAAFAKEKSLNYMILKEFNPWLRDTRLSVRPGKSYQIAVPKREDLFY
jgi:hypothetical protein